MQSTAPETKIACQDCNLVIYMTLFKLKIQRLFIIIKKAKWVHIKLP